MDNFDDFTLISAYSRQQAIDDGVLVDVSVQARETGILLPTVLTAHLHQVLEDIPAESCGQDYRGRLHDVLWMTFLKLKSFGTKKIIGGEISGRGAGHHRWENTPSVDRGGWGRFDHHVSRGLLGRVRTYHRASRMKAKVNELQKDNVEFLEAEKNTPKPSIYESAKGLKSSASTSFPRQSSFAWSGMVFRCRNGSLKARTCMTSSTALE